MATIPKLATYSSLDGTVEITISSVDPSIGEIQGTYKHNFTPKGAITVSGKIGGYAWVNNSEGGSGTAPFNINFTASVRPDGFPYCIIDFWNGFYTTQNTLMLSGVRSYVNNDGTTQSIVLGTLELYQP
ncbi:hypothetical protein [Kordia sp.]|uniref:hypothetical protein n=1 Tax=Kordia sp. TaxID=1965332 RepID=UPI003B58F182